ncbi:MULTISPECIES: acetate kinase [unclassified Microbulbifer]|uniref:acetate/propionate family kinase n=1 Tax=unclassified Microbulbifer TaxID=2619833 RepID=UPI0027E58FF9|nr:MULTISPECIES: acetate kinase [unclassified Microbulbifer]
MARPLREQQALAVNLGSSSLKVTGFARERNRPWKRLLYRNWPLSEADPGEIAERLTGSGIREDQLLCIAHRYVHGGALLSRSAALDGDLLKRLESTAALAPLHNPPALEWMREFLRLFPSATQIAVADSGFFADLPEAARRYPLPAELVAEHALRRYGFHGLAHGAMWRRWCEITGRSRGRLITLQLGAGCSAAAIKDGKPLATSMGFTPLEGLVMGRRAGDLDPGLLLYLHQTAGLEAAALDEMLNRRAGLMALAGSDDMRALLARDDRKAKLAVDIFCRGVRKYIGAYLAELGGADALIFSGGIGEHQPRVRAQILAPLEPLGFPLDATANAAATSGEADIGTAGADIRVLPADEARELLLSAEQQLQGGDS